MPNHPPDATDGMKLHAAHLKARDLLIETDQAWLEYLRLCEVDPAKEEVSRIYQNVNLAKKLCVGSDATRAATELERAFAGLGAGRNSKNQ